jgi:hypothetical protein
MMIPRESRAEYLDVADAMNGRATEIQRERGVLALEDLMLDNVYVTGEAR